MTRLLTACVLVPAACLSLCAAERLALPAFVSQYCADCHDSVMNEGGLDLDSIRSQPVGQHPELWEKAVRKLRARLMPPPGKKRPDEKTYDAMIGRLAASLDAAAAENPNPGRTETMRRLNRTEYQNAIRDLLDLEIDAADLLPRDDASHGFDNVTVATLSPTLLERYIAAAQKISALAVGRADSQDTAIYRVPADLTQENHVEGLPLGTRGGTLIEHFFPADGEYEFQVRLARDRNEEVEGLSRPHEMVLLLDRKEVRRFTISPAQDHRHDLVDQHLKVRLPVTSGPHQVGVTFPRQRASLLETKRQPYAARFNMHRHPRTAPAVFQVSIDGPYDVTGPGQSPSRKRIFVARPGAPDEAERCAKQILATLMRRACRRPVTDSDVERAMAFYRDARAADQNFDAGIEAGLSAILVSPEFLFKIEADPEDVPPGSAYEISDLELASRLSFFLWSSIPDEQLLSRAERGELRQPGVLESEVRRMLADERSRSLALNFAGQWLYLRNLDSFSPDLRLFPGFDHNLRLALRTETEQFFASIVREDRSVLDLLAADYTFLNWRLAEHYGIPHVWGSRFRRVHLSEDSRRGGLLRHGSILAITSYATRTSPVLRGDWILENILGTPTPPPPANVPALKENTVAANLSVRERLAEHRANPACASCHNLMDPIGFALENFDAVGRWRFLEEGEPVNASGGLPDGSEFNGIDGLEKALLQRPELFVGTLTEKLMTFALGRGIESYDAPAVRKILRQARAQDYRFSAIVLGIVNSTPFQMRKSI